jgi:hypothetical protein
MVHFLNLFISSWNFRLTLLAFWRRLLLGIWCSRFCLLLLSSGPLAVDTYCSWGSTFLSAALSAALSVLWLRLHWQLATGGRVSRSYFLSRPPSVRVVVLMSRSFGAQTIHCPARQYYFTPPFLSRLRLDLACATNREH